MNIADIIILIITAAAVVFAARHIIGKGGSCDCGSSSCPHSKDYDKQQRKRGLNKGHALLLF